MAILPSSKNYMRCCRMSWGRYYLQSPLPWLLREHRSLPLPFQTCVDRVQPHKTSPCLLFWIVKTYTPKLVHVLFLQTSNCNKKFFQFYKCLIQEMLYTHTIYMICLYNIFSNKDVIYMYCKINILFV